jgi:hypothetical protein
VVISANQTEIESNAFDLPESGRDEKSTRLSYSFELENSIKYSILTIQYPNQYLHNHKNNHYHAPHLHHMPQRRGYVSFILISYSQHWLGVEGHGCSYLSLSKLCTYTLTEDGANEPMSLFSRFEDWTNCGPSPCPLLGCRW